MALATIFSSGGGQPDGSPLGQSTTYAGLPAIPADAGTARYWVALTQDDGANVRGLYQPNAGLTAWERFMDIPSRVVLTDPQAISRTDLTEGGTSGAQLFARDQAIQAVEADLPTDAPDYAVGKPWSTQLLDAWGRSRRVRRIFDFSGSFDFTALGYADRTAVFLRNISTENGGGVTYSAAGTNTLNLTSAAGKKSTVLDRTSFTLEPGNMVFMEKDGAETYAQIISGERIFAFDNYSEANAFGAMPHDSYVTIRSTEEVFARKTSLNAVSFPANGQPNADWFRIGGGTPLYATNFLTAYPEDAASTGGASTSSESVIAGWGLRPSQTAFTGPGELRVHAVADQGEIEIAFIKGLDTSLVTFQVQSDADASDLFSQSINLQTGALTQPPSPATNQLDLTTEVIDAGDYWLVKVSGARPDAVNVFFWANNLGDGSAFMNYVYAFRVIDPSTAALAVDQAQVWSGSFTNQAGNTGYVWTPNTSLGAAITTTDNSTFDLAEGWVFEVQYIPTSGPSNAQFVEVGVQIDGATTEAFTPISDDVGSAADGGGWLSLIDTRGGAQTLRFIRTASANNGNHSAKLVIKAVAKGQETVVAVPVATVSKAQVQVSVSGGATTINGGQASGTYTEGAGQNTLVVDMDVDRSIDKSATEAALLALPSVSTAVVTDTINGVIEFTLEDGGGDVTFPITTVATVDGVQVFTFQTNNNVASASPIEGWTFFAGTTGSQIRARNDSPNKRVAFQQPFYRQATAQGDLLASGAYSNSPQTYEPGSVRQLTQQDFGGDAGGGAAAGDVEYNVMEVWEFDPTDRLRVSKIHTLVIAAAVGNGWNNTDWRVEVHPA